jgi:CubicO group peptidase (beta-lactamase class C family)
MTTLVAHLDDIQYRLVDAGEVDLDAPVRRYVPTFSWLNPAPRSR